jgi:hypothetical protein
MVSTLSAERISTSVAKALNFGLVAAASTAAFAAVSESVLRSASTIPALPSTANASAVARPMPEPVEG